MNNRKHNTHLSQSDIALQIESLVQAIERSDTPAFRITHKRSGYEQVEQTRLSRSFSNVQQMYNLFDDRVPYDYSEHLLAFREASWNACIKEGEGCAAALQRAEDKCGAHNGLLECCIHIQ